MKRMNRIGLLALAILLLFSISGITSMYKPSVVNAQISLSDSDVPQGVNDEVAWWVNRYTLVLFNSSLPGDKSANAAITLSSRTELKPVPQGNSVTYYSTGGCKMRVAYPNPGTVPSSGTLEGCNNTDKSVRLEKRANGKIDGYYKKASSGQAEQITMPIYVGHLDACGSDGKEVDVDNNDYKVDGVFEKIGQGGQRYDATWQLKDGSGGTKVRLRQVDTSKNPISAQQFGYCPDGDFGYLGYGASGDTHSAKGSDYGRTVYFEKNKTYTEVFNSISEDARAYNTQALKQAEFIRFFSDPKMMDIVRLCSSKLSSAPSDLKTYAIDTLIRPIPGPFSDCLRDNLTGKTSSTGQSFDSIDSIQAADTVGAPDPAAANGGDCGGGIPIISDLICNLVKWAFNVIFDIFTGVIGVLTNPPAVLNGQDTSLDKMWASLRNIANILFLLSFLFVVFQYIADYNVADAYFIKKFVPRLVIAVILVQASGWITRELVYFFDDLGNSIQPILFSAAGISRGNGFSIQGGAATVAFFASPAIIGILAVFAIVFLIILVITILVLALRYVAILVLAIFAPLAFACLAIPQLEGTFKKWLKTFVQLLAMHPIIMILLAASSIVGSVLNGGGVILQLMSLIVQFAPFIVLPFTFKFAGGLMGSVTAKLQGIAKQQGKKAYDKTNFAQTRAAKKKDTEGRRVTRGADSYRNRALSRADDAANGRGIRRMRGALSTRNLGTGDERTEALAMLRAQQAQESVRTQTAEEQARKTVIGGRAFGIKQHIDTMGSQSDKTAYLMDEVRSGDSERVQAALQVAGATQNDQVLLDGMKHLRTATVTNSDGTQVQGSQIWNQALSDNYPQFADTTPAAKVSLTPGMDPNSIIKKQLENFKGMSDKERAGMKDAQWKNLHDLAQASPDAVDHDLAVRLFSQAHSKLDDKGEIKGGDTVDELKRRAGIP